MAFIISNALFKFFPLKVDSVEDYIPAGLSIGKIIRGGVTNFLESWYRLIHDKFLAYTFWVGLIFAITDESIVAASFLSSVFGALIIYMVFHITKDLYDIRTAKWTALLLTLSPFFIFISSVIMRDTMVTFFICWFYRLWLLHDKTPKKRYLWLMTFALLYAGYLRPPIMVVIISSLLTYKLFFEKKEDQSQALRMLIKYAKSGIVVIGFLVLAAYFTGIISIKSIIENRLTSGIKYVEIDEINKRLKGAEEAKSNYYPVPKHDSPITIIKYMPLLIVYFLASPFPWQVQKATQLLAMFDSMMLWFVYLFFMLEFRSFIKRNKKWAVILFSYFILGICSSSIVQTNVAGSERHRIMFTFLMLPFAVHRLVTWWYGKKRKQRYAMEKFPSGRILIKPVIR